MSYNLSIVQYNCGNSNAQASRALFDSLSYPQVLAIQEPFFNRHTKSTYCPKPYELAYEACPETRVCFMIRRDVGAARWRRTQYGPNTASLQLVTGRGKITIINVYNPRSAGPRIREWRHITTALNDAEGETLLVGDFNVHHPAWGGIGVACEQHADHLLVEIERRELRLLTLKGEATWRRGVRKSVIDLTFASQALSERVIFCGPEERWALSQDHIPIRIEFDIHASRETHRDRKRFALEKLDIEGLTKALRQTQWDQDISPLQGLQEALEALLPRFCPKARPCLRARPNWSPQATELLAAAKQARRTYTASHEQIDLHRSRRTSKQLKKEMQRVSRANWRRLVDELTNSQKQQKNDGLWRLSRWSRRTAGKPHTDPHIPGLRRNEREEPTTIDKDKTQILIEKFFPTPMVTSHIRDACDPSTNPEILLDPHISTEEVLGIINKLPNGKATGPDGIPNEVLKRLAPEISAGLAQGIRKAFASGSLPARYKESTTIVLRKEGKKDYSLPGSYRPIALENTLAKIVEKVLATRLSRAAEAHFMLPWTQMGTRKDRSTASAIGLLTTCVETAWRARPGSVVSMLSLDLSGAFDNVPHAALLNILRQKGLPGWLVQSVACFLSARRTRIAFTGYESDWIETNTGIPQGSPLSPILFLFFISGLLEQFQDPEKGTLGFGFVDDTYLVTWGSSAAQNCQRLSAAHSQCQRWAEAHGAKFASDKYQLMHFTRNRRHNRGDLTSTVQIDNHQVEVENHAIRVLGVWLDPRLTWKEHVAQATRKGVAASEALARLATSTWGPSARNSRLLYTAVVRPTLLYGVQEWGTSLRGAGDSLAKVTFKPLEKVQNNCLRRITGAYKRTPRAVLERETQIPPIDLYIKGAKQRYINKVKGYPVEREIAKTADAIWDRLRNARITQPSRRPRTSREHIATLARERIQDMNEWLEEAHRRRRLARETRTPRRPQGRGQDPRPPRPRRPPKEGQLLAKRNNLEWRRRWEATLRERRGWPDATIWSTPWALDTRTLYAGLSKAEATALFLLRSEVIGLNAWLASIQVPDINPACACAWHTHTVRHVMLHCPRYNRVSLLMACGTERLEEILTKPACAQHAARWFIRAGILGQFRVAKEIGEEEVEGYKAFEDAEEW